MYKRSKHWAETTQNNRIAYIRCGNVFYLRHEGSTVVRLEHGFDCFNTSENIYDLRLEATASG